MNYLAIDTANKNLTVIICKEGNIYKYYDNECGVKHSTELMPRVEELALKADFDFKTADFFACVIGAGSFTGIRIGVATIKAMCFAFDKPCLAITSFDALAYNKADGKILAIIDAKHDGYYVCGYNDGVVDLAPSFVSGAEVKKLSEKYKLVSSSEIDATDCETISMADGLIKAIEKKVDFITKDTDALTPLYVRKSQAEEGR